MRGFFPDPNFAIKYSGRHSIHTTIWDWEEWKQFSPWKKGIARSSSSRLALLCMNPRGGQKVINHTLSSVRRWRYVDMLPRRATPERPVSPSFFFFCLDLHRRKRTKHASIWWNEYGSRTRISRKSKYRRGGHVSGRKLLRGISYCAKDDIWGWGLTNGGSSWKKKWVWCRYEGDRPIVYFGGTSRRVHI
jgi:hypothetical protein